MFTGIIEFVGTVERIDRRGGGRLLVIRAPFAADLRVDQSVAVAGVCQTVVACDADTFSVVAIEETLAKTNLGALHTGDPVNLERAMRPDGRLDGHLVQGHVDTTVEVVSATTLEASWMYRLRFDPAFASYVIPVGSITLDGISLTVARLDGDLLSVAIIPHTFENTTVGRWKPGTKVNAEFDMIGKYVVRHLERVSKGEGITSSWLQTQGFDGSE